MNNHRLKFLHHSNSISISSNNQCRSRPCLQSSSCFHLQIIILLNKHNYNHLSHGNNNNSNNSLNINNNLSINNNHSIKHNTNNCNNRISHNYKNNYYIKIIIKTTVLNSPEIMSVCILRNFYYLLFNIA